MFDNNGRTGLLVAGRTALSGWTDIEDAVTEARDKIRKSCAILGYGSNNYTFYDLRDADPSNSEFPVSNDEIPIESRNTFFYRWCYADLPLVPMIMK